MLTKFIQLFLIALAIALGPMARGQTLEVFYRLKSSTGALPSGSVMQASDGNFYGTTVAGANGYGTIYRITPTGGYTNLFSFLPDGSMGRFPRGTLVEAGGGNLYGTCDGGANEKGLVFRITTNGAFTTLFSFNETNGASPGALILGSDGNLYGTTFNGGTFQSGGTYSHSLGTVFKMTLEGELITLISFDGTNGMGPRGLTQASNGNLYGTSDGGVNGFGTVFRMTTNGALTTLVSFNGTNGNGPGELIEGSDGNLYGTTSNGGENDYGTAFRLTTEGVLTTLASFNNTNGSDPSGLIQASNGKFYGTTSFGLFGVAYLGTVFEMTADGKLTTLISFDHFNGSNPSARLLQGTDSNLYGTTYLGGIHNNGVIFRIVMPVALNLRVSGNDLVLSWPTNALGFTLQSTLDLNSPTDWIDSINTPVVVGSQFTVTNSISGSAQFYRLKKP